MIKKENDFKIEAVLDIAKKMCLAARTAPKARGVDLLEIAVISGDTIQKLSKKMKEIGERESHQTFLRDCESILHSQAIVLIGTKVKTIGLKYCSFCGKPNCAEAEKAGVICSYNSGDLGIAIGSAVSVAENHRVDNRIMYSVGKAVVDMEMLGKEVKVAYGIPLSVSSKNPFFDRK
ncbi:MAG: hypothetical protein FD145_154 [Candidatus Saganbacteria bacterium]|uniref:DUF2148 domain-containing protein n=1 Tax=Candidatus Saganbacteria bacterium TaxID=2575572 RepID=A0A833NXT3_UNCSA|nr:MAG: hypothetical protein FD145_154 [Candidatus Saganbacteria bacterium]